MRHEKPFDILDRHKFKINIFLFVWFFSVLTFFPVILYSPADAREFPSGPIKYITPTPTGGTLDIIGRLIQPYLQKYLGTPVIIENVPGASHKIGLTKVWNGKPDGYTITSNSIPQNIIGETLIYKTDYRIKEFAYVCAMSKVSTSLFVNWDSWQTFEELLEAAKQRTLVGAVSGIGSGSHLSGLLAMDKLKVKVRWVNYDSGGEAVTALAGKHVDFTITPIATALSLYNAKRIRPLLVFDTEPDTAFPEIPTPKQRGIEISSTPVYFGVLAPPKTPQNIVKMLEKAFETAINDPAVQKVSKARNLYISFMSGKDYKRETEKQYELVEKCRDLVKDALK